MGNKKDMAAVEIGALALARGATYEVAAQEAGVSRATIGRWVREDSDFARFRAAAMAARLQKAKTMEALFVGQLDDWAAVLGVASKIEGITPGARAKLAIQAIQLILGVTEVTAMRAELAELRVMLGGQR